MFGFYCYRSVSEPGFVGLNDFQDCGILVIREIELIVIQTFLSVVFNDKNRLLLLHL